MKYSQSNLFKLAHQFTKSIMEEGDNYKATFGMVLKMLNQDITITLQDICDELNISDRKARRVLRNEIKSHDKSNRWSWNGAVPQRIINVLTA